MRPKNEEKDKAKIDKGDVDQSQPKSRTEEWREAERDAQAKEQAAENARAKANFIASGLASELIEKHGGACVELDGVKYSPKAGATRSMKDGTSKAPRYPFQLVRAKDKGVVEV